MVCLGAGVANSQSVVIYTKSGDMIKYEAEDVEKVVFKPMQVFDPTNLLSEEYVPCEGFRNWIDTHLGDGSGYYSLEQAAAYTGEINLSRQESVTDITGIEYFTGLTSLKAEDAYFGNFDVAALKSLQYLQIVNTRVSSLDLSDLHDLKTAAVGRNKITELILGEKPVLQSLWCDANQLSELDLSGCPALTTLVCSFNQLTSLSIPICPLVTLAAHQNPIGTIALGHIVKTLDTVNLTNCQLKALDLRGATKLTYLECSDNPFEEAPVLTGCTRLENLRMENVTTVDFGRMDFSECTNLNVLRLDFSKIGTSINLSSNRRLYELSLQACGLEEINIAGLINLGYVNVSDNNFKRLDVSAADGIFTFFANRNASHAQVKVWPEFNLDNPESQYFFIDSNIELVYSFTD